MRNDSDLFAPPRPGYVKRITIRETPDGYHTDGGNGGFFTLVFVVILLWIMFSKNEPKHNMPPTNHTEQVANRTNRSVH